MRRPLWMSRAGQVECAAAVLVLGLAGPARAVAQDAWVAPKGELNVSVTYQWLSADRHFFSGFDGPELTPFEIVTGVDRTSNVVYAGTVQSHSVAVGADLGVTDRLAVSGSLLAVAPRYLGAFPHPGSVDDGHFHSSVQDMSLGARYMLGDGVWAFTPFANATIPVADYIVLGHASQGLGLNILELGASTGRILTLGPRTGFVQGTYGYGITEQPEDDIPMNRSRADVEGGVFLGRFTVLANTSWRKVHGGVEWSEHAHGLDELFSDHDRLAAVREWRYGLGLAFDVSAGSSVYVSFSDFIKGANTHDARTISVGIDVARQVFGGLTLGEGVVQQREQESGR